MRRQKRKAFKQWCIKLTVKHPTTVMVTGCMTASGFWCIDFVHVLMNRVKYISTMEGRMLPSAKAFFDENHANWGYQDDNVSCHRAKRV